VKRRLVLLGPPASGKGTLADALHTQFGIPVASPGAMLRAEKAAGTPLGIEADKLTRGGKLVEDRIINPVVHLWLSHESAEGFVFDGYPRTLGQAEALDQMLAERNSRVDAALLLEASLETLRRRVESRATCSKCGNIVSVGVDVANLEVNCPRCGGAWSRRADDNAETLKTRFEEYAEKTAPVVSYYDKRGVLHRVDTERPRAEVVARVLEILH
jgi:adenylate kinase